MPAPHLEAPLRSPAPAPNPSVRGSCGPRRPSGLLAGALTLLWPPHAHPSSPTPQHQPLTPPQDLDLRSTSAFGLPADIFTPLPPADRGNYAAMDVLRNTALHVPSHAPPPGGAAATGAAAAGAALVSGGGSGGAPPHAKVSLAATADKLADTGKVRAAVLQPRSGAHASKHDLHK